MKEHGEKHMKTSLKLALASLLLAILMWLLKGLSPQLSITCFALSIILFVMSLRYKFEVE